jgi:hypothetical protein
MSQSLEETDALRHREVMTKALGALILLLLKWFKISRESYWENQGLQCLIPTSRHNEIPPSWAHASGLQLSSPMSTIARVTRGIDICDHEERDSRAEVG